MIAHLALLAILQSPLDQPISYEGEPARPDVVMAEIGKQAGIEIKVQGAPLRDYVYVNLKKRPLRSTLELFANVCQATWKQEEDRIMFRATWPMQEDEAWIQDWLDKNPVQPESNLTLPELAQEALALQESAEGRAKADEIERFTRRMPLHQAHLKVVHDLGAEKIGELSLSETRFYSPEKAELFRPLPSESLPTLNHLTRECDSFRNELLKLGADQRMAAWNHSITPYLNTEFSNLTWLLTFNRDGDRIQSLLTAIEPSTNTVKVVNGFLILKQPEEHESKLVSLNQPLRTPPDWPETITPNLKTRFAHLEEDEVLTDYVDEPLRQLAELKQKDVIAIVPDLAFYSMLQKSSRTPRTNTLGDSLARAYAANEWMEESDDAILLRPDNLALWRQSRVPRAEVSRAMRDGMRRGSVGVDALAQVALASDSSYDWMISTSALSIVVRDIYTGNAKREMLKCFALFPATTRKDAQSGLVRLHWRDLSSEQRRLLLQAAFANQVGNTINATAQIYRFRNGIPDDAPVHVEVLRQQQLYGRSEPEMRPVKLTLSQLAEAQAWHEAGTKSRLSAFTEFVQAQEATLSITVIFDKPNDIELTTTIEGPNRDQEFHSFDKLPSETLEEYNRLLRIHRETVKRRGSGPPNAS